MADHGLKDPMNSISRIMEKVIGGKKGRRNGKGDTVQRKVNCGLTEDGKSLYLQLFPEHSDTNCILIARHHATVTYHLA